MNTVVKGFVKNISIPVFELSGLRNTGIRLSGSVKGLPDAQKAVYDLNLQDVHTSEKDIRQLVPAKLIPLTISIPVQLSAKGSFKGSMQQFASHLQLSTSKGNATAHVQLSHKDQYSATISTQNLDLGYLLKQEKNMGRLTVQASLQGKGFDYKKASAGFNARVLSAELKGYTYTHLTADGSLQNGSATIHTTIDDPNIAFNLQAIANVVNPYPGIELQLQLDTLNLQALHITNDTLNLHGTITANLPVTNPDSLVGNISVTGLSVFTKGKTIDADTILVSAIADGTERQLRISSEPLQADLTGTYKLTEIARVLQHAVSPFYTIAGFKDTVVSPQQWQLHATLLPSPMVLHLIPGLKGSEPVILAAHYTTKGNDLGFSVSNKKILYEGQQLNGLDISGATQNNGLDIFASLLHAKAGSIDIYKTRLGGLLLHNKLDFSLGVQDKADQLKYRLGGSVDSINSRPSLSLHEDSLLLDYDQWAVSAGNFIQYDSTGLQVHNFKISRNNQSLYINSSQPVFNAPIQVGFTDFHIGTLTKMINQDSLLADGIINGEALVKDIAGNPLFTSDISVADLSYKKDTLGNLLLKVDNAEANTYAAAISLQGHGSNLQLNGKYFNNTGSFDMQLKADSLNLATVKPFAAGQLNTIEGHLKANVRITGTTDKPLVNGALHFDHAYLTPTLTGERLKLPNDTILVNEQGIHFNRFTLSDSSGNNAVVDGSINTTDFRTYGFAVNLDAKDFHVVNTPQASGKLFYGKLNVDTHIGVTGDMVSPKIEANLRVNKQTNFTLVLPTNDPEMASREGVVQFVDKHHPEDTSVLKTILDSINNQSKLLGLDMNATIETDSAAVFNMIIDERNGDALTLKGKADLAAGIDKSGKISLTGSYALQQGSYQLSLSLLKRKFDIQKGSTITWTGDPMSAIVDITASYLANTASIDLVGPQLAGRPASEVNKFKQKLPFKINLKMEGELLKPNIRFDIVLPAETLTAWPEVDTKLQQVRNDESELNKQVFALLLLNRFVGENPLESNSGTLGMEGVVRESASSILTDQLNRLAGSLINGIDVNFGINSSQDYSTGEAQNKTDLTVGVSKSLLNDRLKVNVSSNFELEGPNAGKSNANNFAGDVAVDYQLTKDGRYMIRAYRKNKYESVIEGQIIETGMSFILTFDYNKFKEIFQPRKAKETKPVNLVTNPAPATPK